MEPPLRRQRNVTDAPQSRDSHKIRCSDQSNGHFEGSREPKIGCGQAERVRERFVAIGLSSHIKRARLVLERLGSELLWMPAAHSGLPSHPPHFRWWLPRACVRAYVVVTLERCERTSMRDRVVTMKIRQATGTTSTKTTPRAPRPVIGHRQITSQQHPSPPR